MDVCLVTGSAGLIGSESVRFFSKEGFHVAGIDNDMRSVFFGKEASTKWNLEKLKSDIKNYRHYDSDIRNKEAIEKIYKEYNSDIKVVIHAAAQPSHDWAAKDPYTDFSINALGTLIMLETTRKVCPGAVFIFTSTNKVYGDLPNALPLIETDTRWELQSTHPYYAGIDETMSIDQSKHSLFGASKIAADVAVQEYGRYFGMNTVCFRGGCLTGPNHSGAMLHGFLAYLMRCAIKGMHYEILGYKGKQVRDNIHSLDLVNMFWHFYKNPQPAKVYNAGGGRHSNCSITEAIRMCEEITGKRMIYSYTDTNRIGDHIWWISDVGRFKSDYPDWNYRYGIYDILSELHGGMTRRVI
ncbi:MAG: NAD-dependent epimerase/dehydratase family protein [Nitrospirae bacterium YQR-1]